MAMKVKMPKKMGGKDGARHSKKKQVSALLPKNKVGDMDKTRKKRMAMMEAKDGPV